jgi:DNA-binding beta-propeller fold protein YncE
MSGRRLRSGYTDFGGIKIPPNAPAVVLTDRADGTLYLVSFNTTNSVLRLSLNTSYSTISRREGIRIYEANDGPYVDEDGRYKLIVRSGRIGFDYIPYPTGIADIDQAPNYARTTSGEEEMIIDQTDTNPLLVHIGIRT